MPAMPIKKVIRQEKPHRMFLGRQEFRNLGPEKNKLLKGSPDSNFAQKQWNKKDSGYYYFGIEMTFYSYPVPRVSMNYDW
jgi:hypothetical protein